MIRRAEQTPVKADKNWVSNACRLQNGLETVRYILEDLSRELHASESQASKLDVCREEVEKLINTCLGG